MKLTLAIVTCKRPDKLKTCLTSLARQTQLPDQVIIVDNDINQSAKTVSDAFKESLRVKYFVTPIPNTPKARNVALKQCKTELLGFIDDDCVLDKNWVSQAKKIRWEKPVAYLLGKIRLLNPDNWVTKCLYYRQQYWFMYDNARNKPYAGSFSTDTKNMLINYTIIKAKKVTFDEQLFLNPVGDHSDTDFGIQLNRFGLMGLSNDDLIVGHEESPKFTNFLTKAYQRGRVAYLISAKWKMQHEFVFLPDARVIKWLIRIKCWPGDFNRWVGYIPENLFNKLGIFLLMKIYDLFYLRGYVDESKKQGVHLDLYSEIKRS
jgi:glycosyltransferase involved in cell wall biosynthesis